MACRRGEIHLVDFDPAEGAEIKKTRPALILQTDISNQSSPITIVAGITSHVGSKLYPTEVLIASPEGGLTVDSVVQLNQIRSVDKARLVQRLGKTSEETMERVDMALKVSLGLLRF